MHSGSKYLFVILILLCSVKESFSLKSSMKKLVTKQKTKRIRYVSQDGKITYFQNRYGHLYVSKNFNTFKIINGVPGENYSIIKSKNESKIIILKEIIDKKGKYYLKGKKIYVSSMGSKEVLYLRDGLNPDLHLNGNFLSYFSSKFKRIFILNLDSNFSQNVMELKINSTINPYFIPKVLLLDENIAIYTSMRKNGKIELKKYNHLNSKETTFYSTSKINHNLDICLLDKNIYVFEYPFFYFEKKSKLTEFKLSGVNKLSKPEVIYSSSDADIGKIICRKDRKGMKNIYFIKKFKRKNFKKLLSIDGYLLKGTSLKKDFFNLIFDKFNPDERMEVVAFNPETISLTILSDIKYATNIIEVDDLILLPYRENFYILNEERINDDKVEGI
jgi:hypothetical protein